MINDQFPLKGSSREMGRDGHTHPEEVDVTGSEHKSPDSLLGLGSEIVVPLPPAYRRHGAPAGCRQVASEEATHPPSEAAERREPQDGVSPPETLPGRAARERHHTSAA